MADRPLPAYDGHEPYVFVSYSHGDDDLVYPEIRWLQDQGFNVWYDEGIGGASRWLDAIAGRLGGCHLLLFYVSPTSVESQVCREELEFALDGDRPVLSVHLEATTLPDGIRLAIANRQALQRHELESDDYERKLLSTIATYLDKPLPTINESRRAPSRRFSRKAKLPLAVLCSLLVGGIATWVATRPEPPATDPLVRFPVDLPAGIALPLTNVGISFAISADGQRVVFNGAADAAGGITRRLYVRSLAELEATPIRGVEGNLGNLSLSPDGEYVVFVDIGDGAIKKVPVSGGSPVTIAENNGPTWGLSWGTNGTIIFRTPVFPGLMRVSASGGIPERLTEPPEGEFHWLPHVLADGSAVLFSVGGSSLVEINQIAVLSLLTGKLRILTEGVSPRVTSSGHLLFLREGSIWAMAFDADRLEVSGVAVPVLENVAVVFNAYPQFSVADDGSMVYLQDTSIPSGDSLVWVDLDGNETPLAAPAGNYIYPRISRDQRRVVVGTGKEDLWATAVWIHSLERDMISKLTLEDANYATFLWSPDGKKIMYSSTRNGAANLYWRNADSTGVETRLTTSPNDQFAYSWSPDGRQVLFEEFQPSNGAADLARLTMAEVPIAELIFETEFSERHPSLSPDGHWLAYQSFASGEWEVYVRPYPDVDSGRWPISNNGGREPVWSPDGKFLYYIEGSYIPQMMSVAIEANDGFAPGNPQAIIDLQRYNLHVGRNYALHPNGEKFLMVKRGDLSGSESQHLIFVQNWLEEVKRLVPTE